MANPIYNTTSLTSFRGYVEHAKETVNSGGDVNFVKSLAGGDPEVMTLNAASAVNKKAVKLLDALLAKIAAGIDAKNYKLELKEIPLDISGKTDWKPTAANIMKKGDKIPFGYLAETILQAAIVARFVYARPETTAVTASMVAKCLLEFIDKKSPASAVTAVGGFGAKSKAINKAFEYDVANLNAKIGKDKVYVLYSLNDSAFKWLSSRKSNLANNSDLKPYIADSIAYVNGGACRDHSHYFYTNGRVDRIDILSLGISGQGKTKADIRTQYYEGWKGGKTGTPHAMTLNLSVKINHVEQIGQVTGLTSDKYQILANSIGAKLSDTTIKKIDKIIKDTHGKDDKNAHFKVYQLAYNDMKKVSSVGALFKGIEHFISLTEAKTLTIVDIGSGLRTYFVKNLKALEKSCAGQAVKSEVRVTGGGNYNLTVSVGNKELIKFSSRKTGGIYRNFVLTGESLRQTLSKEL
jgi:hypothetical protein